MANSALTPILTFISPPSLRNTQKVVRIAHCLFQGNLLHTVSWFSRKIRVSLSHFLGFLVGSCIIYNIIYSTDQNSTPHDPSIFSMQYWSCLYLFGCKKVWALMSSPPLQLEVPLSCLLNTFVQWKNVRGAYQATWFDTVCDHTFNSESASMSSLLTFLLRQFRAAFHQQYQTLPLISILPIISALSPTHPWIFCF